MCPMGPSGYGSPNSARPSLPGFAAAGAAPAGAGISTRCSSGSAAGGCICGVRSTGRKLQELLTYIENSRGFIVDYGDRHRHGEPIASSFVESGVNQVVAKRLVKKQQMAWSDAAAHGLLQIRAAVLNSDLRHHFELWYPSMAAEVATHRRAA